MLVPSNLSTVVRIALVLFAVCMPLLYIFRHSAADLGYGVGILPSFPTSTSPSVPSEDGSKDGEVAATPGGGMSEKEQFIEKILGTEIDGPFNANPLAELCVKTQWQEGLVMSCEATRGGGMGNIRNVFIDCVRLVIEAGGKNSEITETKEYRD
jgi:hypothetical protein